MKNSSRGRFAVQNFLPKTKKLVRQKRSTEGASGPRMGSFIQQLTPPSSALCEAIESPLIGCRACRRRHHLNIYFTIVDVDGASRVNCKSLEKNFKNTPVGLQQPHRARKQDSLKPFQTFESTE